MVWDFSRQTLGSRQSYHKNQLILFDKFGFNYYHKLVIILPICCACSFVSDIDIDFYCNYSVILYA